MSDTRRRRLTWLWAALGLLVVVAIALGAGPPIYSRISGGGFYSMPSGSMKPTLFPGDQILGKPLKRAVQRGDIIVFNHPKEPGTDYIKRVIALPGDTFQMIDGAVHLNGAALDLEPAEVFEEAVEKGQRRQYCLNNPVPEGELCQNEQWTETLPSGRKYQVLNLGNTRFDVSERMTIPAEHIMVLGDNRDNSVDSRFASVGYVPIQNVKHLIYMVHTSNDPETLSPRWDRLFKRLDSE